MRDVSTPGVVEALQFGDGYRYEIALTNKDRDRVKKLDPTGTDTKRLYKPSNVQLLTTPRLLMFIGSISGLFSVALVALLLSGAATDVFFVLIFFTAIYYVSTYIALEFWIIPDLKLRYRSRQKAKMMKNNEKTGKT
ncbi:MAG: hypothetical protein ACFFD4_19190 [Candidatus Odinarchaeota archaeon]